MLFKSSNYKSIKSLTFIGLLTLLTGCASSAALESFISPDPKLSEAQNRVKPQPKQVATSLKKSPQTEGAENVVSSDNSQTGSGNSNGLDVPGLDFLDRDLALPDSFPPSFPIYPKAQLKESKLGTHKASGMLIWDSTDNRKAIADYYEAEFAANDWTFIKPFTFNPQKKIARATAVKGETRVDLTLFSTSGSENQAENNTQLSLIYKPLAETIASSPVEDSASLIEELSQQEPESKSPTNKNSKQTKSAPESSQAESDTLAADNIDNIQDFNSFGVDFDDLDRVPEQLQQPLKSVVALDILTPYTGKNNVELSKFAPNEVITRGEYARWLVDANNRYFAGDSGKKIYLAAKTSQPAFKDVKPSHPDFQAIQSLAETGLIPSPLTEDGSSLLFKPNAPLKREDLLTWKVPLDIRDSLPKATIEAIEESWGFQDAAEIESLATRALYADYQNGDRSNVRRIFGYTTLFQPKKAVTRAEAAASLWYFGFQGDGVTANEVLAGESAQQN